MDCQTLAFVNDIKADLYDENVVYAVFDNHKYGDYQPYLFKSSDKGKTWKSIANNLPNRTLLWRLVQDHENSKLMFLGTEYGVYFTLDGAKTWMKLKGGFPNISVRDLAIQKRENDLIAGTFGRGIYILDDYSALRTMNADNEAQLFKPRDGKWYMQRRVLGRVGKATQGDNFFIADNPPYGVAFTYYLKDSYKSKAAQRKKKESEIEKNKGTVGVPEWSVLEAEQKELKPKLWLFISDTKGNIIRRIAAKNTKGISRISWDISTAPTYTISSNNVNRNGSGYMAAPGNYNAQLFKQIEGKYTSIGDKVSFAVKAFGKSALAGNSPDKTVEHWKTIASLSAKINDLGTDAEDIQNAINLMLKAYDRAPKRDENLHATLLKLRDQMLDLEQQFSGSNARAEVGEKDEYPNIRDYMWAASANTTYGPTKSHIKYLDNANKLFNEMTTKLKQIKDAITPLEGKLKQIGAPKIKK